MSTIWNDIQNVRKYQIKEWGGPENDDQNDTEDWIKIRNKQLEKADQQGLDIGTRLHYLNQAAAVLVAEIASINRVYGHRPDVELDTTTNEV